MIKWNSKFLRSAALIFIVVMIAVTPLIVYAVTYNQPTTFTIGDASGALEAYAYQSSIDSGDQLFIGRFYLSYAVPADAPNTVGEAYLGIVRYDGTVLAAVNPVWAFDSGIAQWFFAVYLSDTQVADFDAAFGETMWDHPEKFEVAIVGNPTLTWAGGSPPTEKATSNFTSDSFNSNTDTETTHTTYTEPLIRTLGQYYEDQSGGTLDLIQSVGGVNKLTDDGEQYFGASIANLQLIAPGVFVSSMSAVEFTEDALIVDHYAEVTDTNIHVYGTNWYAQTFTPTADYAFSGMGFRIYRVGNPGTTTIAIRAVAAGVPSGATLASGAINGNNLTAYTGGDWYDIAVTADYELTSGTTYAVLIYAVTGDANNYVGLHSLAAGDYDGGQQCNSANSGVAWAAAAGHDIVFSVLSSDGSSVAYQDQLASTLDETEFGNPSGGFNTLADEMGVSRSWTTALVWLGISVLLAYKVRQRNFYGQANQTFIPIILIMMAIGALTGFVGLWIPVYMAAMYVVAMVFTVFFNKQSV